jgi:hypothetical protein
MRLQLRRHRVWQGRHAAAGNSHGLYAFMEGAFLFRSPTRSKVPNPDSEYKWWMIRSPPSTKDMSLPSGLERGERYSLDPGRA